MKKKLVHEINEKLKISDINQLFTKIVTWQIYAHVHKKNKEMPISRI